MNSDELLYLIFKYRISLDRSQLGRTVAYNHAHDVSVTVIDDDELIATEKAIILASIDIRNKQ